MKPYLQFENCASELKIHNKTVNIGVIQRNAEKDCFGTPKSRMMTNVLSKALCLVLLSKRCLLFHNVRV